jgi:hypothetical protein
MVKIFVRSKKLLEATNDFEIGFLIGMIKENEYIIIERIKLKYKKEEIKNMNLEKKIEEIKKHFGKKIEILGLYISNPTEIIIQTNELKDLFKNQIIFLNINKEEIKAILIKNSSKIKIEEEEKRVIETVIEYEIKEKILVKEGDIEKTMNDYLENKVKKEIKNSKFKRINETEFQVYKPIYIKSQSKIESYFENSKQLNFESILKIIYINTEDSNEEEEEVEIINEFLNLIDEIIKFKNNYWKDVIKIDNIFIYTFLNNFQNNEKSLFDYFNLKINNNFEIKENITKINNNFEIKENITKININYENKENITKINIKNENKENSKIIENESNNLKKNQSNNLNIYFLFSFILIFFMIIFYHFYY